MGNAVGCAPVLDMLRRGVRVGLGSDGYTCDMFESLKVANMLHKHQSGQPSAGWAEPPAMLFSENSVIASACFGRSVGKLILGALADGPGGSGEQRRERRREKDSHGLAIFPVRIAIGHSRSSARIIATSSAAVPSSSTQSITKMADQGAIQPSTARDAW